MAISKFNKTQSQCPLKKIHSLVSWLTLIFYLTTVMYYSLRSKIVGVRRRMNTGFRWLWWPNDTRRRMWDKFPAIYLAVEENPGKNPTRKLTRTRIEPRALWVRGNDIIPRPRGWLSFPCGFNEWIFKSPIIRIKQFNLHIIDVLYVKQNVTKIHAKTLGRHPHM